jgi:hypothetical protein
MMSDDEATLRDIDKAITDFESQEGAIEKSRCVDAIWCLHNLPSQGSIRWIRSLHRIVHMYKQQNPQ